MRTLSYNDGSDILRPEGEGGHISIVDIPQNARPRATVAYRISDESVLVLALSSMAAGREYYYEWYRKAEL